MVGGRQTPMPSQLRADDSVDVMHIGPPQGVPAA
jgi:hypothetical protein